MNNQKNGFSWFLDNLFGLGLKSGEVLNLLESHEKKDELINVANRLWFIDLLRYRTMFSPGNVVPNTIPYFLENEVSALHQYLLFTCIDALAEKTDFITFPEWLNIKKQKKKDKYKINDDNIKKAMGIGDLNEPVNFRFAAYQVYKNCYQPNHGNKISINNFLHGLPEGLKKLLTELYVITKTTGPVNYFSFDQNGCPINTVENWEFELKKWGTRDLDTKVNLIANYYYTILRNPYTHSAKTTLQKPLNHHNVFHLKNFSLVYDYYSEEKCIVRFQQESVEEEILILRLIVIIGWLAKVGFHVDDELINKFRNHQLRREYMFYSIREVERIQKLASIYKNKSYTELIRFHQRWSLAKFNFSFLSRLKNYLRSDTPLENGLIALINSLIEGLQVLINLIEEQNQKYIPKNSFIPTEEEIKILEQTMPIAFDSIKQNISQVDIESKCDEILEYLDELSEWILE
jgi:hypothetical protein